MSTRAIRALRGDDTSKLLGIVSPGEEEEDDDDDQDSEEEQPQRSAFAHLNDESSSSSSSEEGEEEEEDEEEETNSLFQKETGLPCDKERAQGSASKHPHSTSIANNQNEAEQEEDLDALLEEFQDQDLAKQLEVEEEDNEVGSTENTRSQFDLILHGLDTRDLDYDRSLRVSLLHETNNSRRRPLSFGTPRDGWARPPRLVGGGMGMGTYATATETDRMIPWPYTNETPREAWYTFVHSQQAQRDRDDYTDVIQQSGDLNALGMFLAHHPYVTNALLQYSTVLYQSNRSNDGLALLRRCLWIFEISALVGFRDRLEKGRVCFMDIDQEENEDFFESLFQLFRASYVAGMPRTGLAVCRLTLSLDPLRDPKNALLSLDAQSLSVALGSNLPEQTTTLRWFIDLVESGTLELCYEEEEHQYRCQVMDLPNIAYSYALSLFLLGRGKEEGDYNVRANSALKSAMNRFPLVVPQLLEKLEVDTTGRSFQRDWLSVLDFTTAQAKQLSDSWYDHTDDYVALTRLMKTLERIITVFVMQNSSHWSDESILQWMFDNLKEISSEKQSDCVAECPGFALLRYSTVNSAPYNKRIDLLPDDANLLDPNVVAYAMDVQPGRPRFLRNQQDVLQHMNPAGGMQNGRPILGGPPTEVIDPDWPMLEVFWRSFLPWTRVEGVPPARR